VRAKDHDLRNFKKFKGWGDDKERLKILETIKKVFVSYKDMRFNEQEKFVEESRSAYDKRPKIETMAPLSLEERQISVLRSNSTTQDTPPQFTNSDTMKKIVVANTEWMREMVSKNSEIMMEMVLKNSEMMMKAITKKSSS
jgi:hypothetical protein